MTERRPLPPSSSKPSAPPDDARLRQARAAAFRILFEAELPYVWNTLRFFGVRDGDLEDVAHEVFMTVHRRIADYDPTRSPRAWLFTIASHAASDYRRLARHKREVFDEPVDHVDQSPTAEDRVRQAEDQRLVQEALDAVEDGRRTVLVLHDVEGCPVPEIAAALALPLNTAYSRLRLARKEFEAAVTRLRVRRGER